MTRRCSIEGCGKKHYSLGWCRVHYLRYQRHGDPLVKSAAKAPRICSIDGCDKRVFGHGWCSAHYARWRNHGDPLGGRTPVGDALQWLLDHVEHEGDDCLIWPFGKRAGYGGVKYEGEDWRANRLTCFLVHGEPPTSEHEAAHDCGKGHEACVHPKHVYWATPKQNQHDRFRHGTALVGSRNPGARLTERDVREIRNLAATMTQRAIARRYGVAYQTISKIVRGERWKRMDYGQKDRPRTVRDAYADVRAPR